MWSTVVKELLEQLAMIFSGRPNDKVLKPGIESGQFVAVLCRVQVITKLKLPKQLELMRDVLEFHVNMLFAAVQMSPLQAQFQKYLEHKRRCTNPNCGKEEGPKQRFDLCSRCRTARYCSRDCQ